jgi:hypothetical protein
MVTYGHQAMSEQSRLTAALLKIAVLMKRQPAIDFDTLVEDVAAQMQLDLPRFRRYLAQHRQMLTATVKLQSR